MLRERGESVKEKQKKLQNAWKMLSEEEREKIIFASVIVTGCILELMQNAGLLKSTKHKPQKDCRKSDKICPKAKVD